MMKNSSQIKLLCSLLFLFLFSNLLFASNDSNPKGITDGGLQQALSMANSTFKEIESKDNYTDNLTESDLRELPIGIKTVIGNKEYIVGISNATIYPTYAELTLFVSIQTEKTKIILGASGIKFSYKNGINSDVKICLLGDVPIDINGGNGQIILKGKFNLTNGTSGDSSTYVKVDCQGFKELSVYADLVLPRKIAIPCDNNGDTLTNINAKVHASFSTTIYNWNDLLVTVSLPKFQTPKAKDVVFSITSATLDLSDLANAANVSFPSDYKAKYFNYPTDAMWRGVYIKTLAVMLPKSVKKKSNSDRIQFSATDLIIDNNGVTGVFSAGSANSPLLSIDQGTASGWQFSVNGFSIVLEANRLVSGGFNGDIVLPIADTTKLAYVAVFSNDANYSLSVTTRDTINVKVFTAKTTVLPGSSVTLTVVSGDFRPVAIINGNMQIAAKKSASSTKTTADFKGITFTGLKLQTVTPYMQCQSLGTSNAIGLNVAGLAVSISQLNLSIIDEDIKLKFNLGINFQDGKVSGNTDLTIQGIVSKVNGDIKIQPNPDFIVISEIQLAADVGKLDIAGTIRFYENDANYGDGFKGTIMANLKALTNPVSFSIRACFGNFNTTSTSYNYWFVDGYVTGLNAPVAPPVNITGILGGASYHMGKKAGTESSTQPDYIPDSTLGLGINAGVFFNVTSDKTLKGTLKLDIVFNSSGGLNEVGLYGNATIMPDMAISLPSESLTKIFNGGKFSAADSTSELKAKKVSSITGDDNSSKSVKTNEGMNVYFGFVYDNINKEFNANIKAYINLNNGMLIGSSAVDPNLAGYAILHVDQQKWYLHVGTPDNRCGIKVKVGVVELATNAYFMMGYDMPNMPSPPNAVTSILGTPASQRDNTIISNGKGMICGFGVSMAGSYSLGIITANYNAGVGFDLTLKQYPGVSCDYGSGVNKPLGFHTWYADAQAYMYLQASVNVHIDYNVIHADYEIFSGSCAGYLQAKLPNPSWFNGQVVFHYSLLNGVKTGDAKVTVEFGTKCTPFQSGNDTLGGLMPIAFISPSDTNEAGSATIKPLLNLNYNLNNEFTYPTGTLNRVKLENFEVFDGSTSIDGVIEKSQDSSSLTFVPNNILPGGKLLRIYVKVKVERKIGSGSWAPYFTKERNVFFKTENSNQKIDLANISTCYPIINQRNLYLSESSNGYVSFKQGLSSILNFSDSLLEVRFVRNGASPITTSCTYNSSTKKLSYAIPSSLDTCKTYTFELRKKATTSEAAITYFNYDFRVSKYSTFASKVASLNLLGTNENGTRGTAKVYNTYSLHEIFDLNEVSGGVYTYQNKPMLSAYYLYTDNFYTDIIDSMIYGNANTINVDLNSDKNASISTYPSYQWQVNNGATQVSMFCYDYRAPKIYLRDLKTLQDKVADKISDGTFCSKAYIVNSLLPTLTYSNYKINITYLLPDGTSGSSATVSLNYSSTSSYTAGSEYTQYNPDDFFQNQFQGIQ